MVLCMTEYMVYVHALLVHKTGMTTTPTTTTCSPHNQIHTCPLHSQIHPHTWTRGHQHPCWVHCSDIIYCLFIVFVHHKVRTQVPEVLTEIVGKAIVIIHHYNWSSWLPIVLLGCCHARLLATVCGMDGLGCAMMPWLQHTCGGRSGELCTTCMMRKCNGTLHGTRYEAGHAWSMDWGCAGWLLGLLMITLVWRGSLDAK